MIENLYKKESCVIVGRCSDYVLRNEKNVIRLFLYSDMKSKINRAEKYYHINSKNVEKEINRVDKQRAKHYKDFTNREWKSYDNYDLAINVDKLGVEETAEMIKNIIINRNNKTTI